MIDDSSLEDLRSWDAQDSSSRKTSSGLIKLRHGALIITSVKVVHKVSPSLVSLLLCRDNTKNLNFTGSLPLQRVQLYCIRLPGGKTTTPLKIQLCPSLFPSYKLLYSPYFHCVCHENQVKISRRECRHTESNK